MISVIISLCVGSFRCQIFTCIFVYRMIVSSSVTIFKRLVDETRTNPEGKTPQVFRVRQHRKTYQLAICNSETCPNTLFQQCNDVFCLLNKDAELATLRLKFILVGMSLFQWIDALDPQTILQQYIYEHLRVPVA